MKTKKIARLSVAALLVASVAACSDSDSDDPAPTTPPVTPPTGTEDMGGNPGTAETGVLPVIFDRMGRPGVSTALVAAADDKDAYNLEGNPANWAAEFTEALTERAIIIDSLDGEVGNALLGPTPSTLVGLLVDDRLRIDTSVADCDAYLGLEIGLGGCGGRTLERDVIDDTLRHLVSQDNPVSDLADNDSTFQTVWPFLGLPN